MAAALACSATSAPEPPPAATADPADFDAARAWHHLEALVALGPRPSGSRAAERAREYLAAQLERSGFEVRVVPLALAPAAQAGGAAPEAPETEPRRVQPVFATLRGASDDVVLLLAPYTSPSVAGESVPGANEGGSGAAVLLELGRALAQGPRPYTRMLVFVDGDGLEPGRPLGSEAVAAQLDADGVLARTRFALYIDRVGDVDLQVARDLQSNRSHRAFFWESARRLGHADVFAQQGFEQPLAGHRAFLARGFRRIVALVDTRFGGTEPPGAWARTGQDDLAHCAPESLGAVGDVALDALRRIETRLARIDRFARAPIATTASDHVERQAAALTPVEGPLHDATEGREAVAEQGPGTAELPAGTASEAAGAGAPPVAGSDASGLP